MHWLKKGCRCLLAPFFVLPAYLAAALVLGLIPSRTAMPAPTAAADYPVYLVSNGVHINLVLPLHNDIADWRDRLPESGPGDWVYIGWGSRAFYTQVPTWGDLTVPLAAKALLWDDSVLFVRGGAAPLPGSGQVRKIRLNAAQYRQLNADIRRQFAAAAPLPDNPHFYAARGAYQPLQTCNEWVRRRLQPLGVTVPLWSPFDRPLLWHLPRD